MERNLKSLRDSLGLTQKQFAENLGIKLTTYNGYETGTRDPDSDFWIFVARKYKVTTDFLMGYSSDPHKTGLESQKNPPTPAEPEQEERLTKYEVEGVLIALGLIEDGQHISDRDLDVVSYVISILDAWFEEKRQRR